MAKQKVRITKRKSVMTGAKSTPKVVTQDNVTTVDVAAKVKAVLADVSMAKMLIERTRRLVEKVDYDESKNDDDNDAYDKDKFAALNQYIKQDDKKAVPLINQAHCRKMAIVYVFVNVFKAPDKDKWRQLELFKKYAKYCTSQQTQQTSNQS